MWGAIWFLAIPILIQQILIATVGLADKVFAGALPEEVVLPAMDAIGIGSYIGWFISIAVSGVGIGAQALIARAMGSGDVDIGRKVLGQSLMLAFFWGTIVAVGLWFAAEPLGELCQLSAQAKVYLVSYIQIIALGMPACSVMTTGAMALHGSGDTIRPAIVTVAVNIVNVLVSWACSGANVRLGDEVYANPFSWNLHVVGIAIGTAIAYVVGGVLIVLVLRRGTKDLSLRLRDLIPNFSVFWRIARIGIPNFFEGLSMWVANLFVLLFIGQIAAKMAVDLDSNEPVVQGLQGSHVIAVQWESFSFLPGFAIGIAAGTLAGSIFRCKQCKAGKESCLGMCVPCNALHGKYRGSHDVCWSWVDFNYFTRTNAPRVSSKVVIHRRCDSNWFRSDDGHSSGIKRHWRYSVDDDYHNFFKLGNSSSCSLVPRCSP